MKLILNKSERKKAGLLGGTAIFYMTARVELEDGEAEAIYHFRLQDCLVYKAEDTMGGVKQFVSDNAVANPLWRLLPKPPTLEVKGSQLLTGMTFEHETLLGLLFLEGEVKKAADSFYKMVDRAQSFMGEEVIDLPLVSNG